MNFKRPATITSLFALGVLSACHKAPANVQDEQLPSVPTVPTAKEIVPNRVTHGAKAQFLAAAEPFETLTEQAFTRDRATLAKAVGNAEAAARRVKSLMKPPSRNELDKQMIALHRAYRAGDRADLAQASIEIYRIFVTQGSGASSVPAQVSLLDYSGFRYDADLKARPIRWDDMVAAANFASTQWAQVKPHVADQGTVTKFQNTLDNMSASATIKDPQRAAASVKTELDLVDILEQGFNGK